MLADLPYWIIGHKTYRKAATLRYQGHSWLICLEVVPGAEEEIQVTGVWLCRDGARNPVMQPPRPEVRDSASMVDIHRHYTDDAAISYFRYLAGTTNTYNRALVELVVHAFYNALLTDNPQALAAKLYALPQ